MANIYVASSWRNAEQPNVVRTLRSYGHGVYDFRRPTDASSGFHWFGIDPAWEDWDIDEYKAALKRPLAHTGFSQDSMALRRADLLVLVLPSGRSAHLEAGYHMGLGKAAAVLAYGKVEPELMYLWFDLITDTLEEIVDWCGGKHLIEGTTDGKAKCGGGTA
jgi:hypothetical protein